jgi:hypothetical protein
MLAELGLLAIVFLLRSKGLPVWLLLAVVGLCLTSIARKVIQGLRRARIRSGRSPTADRSGLAFLIELARSWPESRSKRLEAIWVVAGNERRGLAGTREILRRIRFEWEQKPTLVVILIGTGHGEEVLISAPADVHLADAAAGELWIPHRRMPWRPVFGRLADGGSRKGFTSCVALIGAGCLREADSLNEGAITRTAQLATEIALRWQARGLKPGRD